MSERSDAPQPEDGNPTLAEVVRDLASQPTGPGRVAQRRKQLLDLAERHTSRGRVAPVAETAWNMHRRLQGVGGMALPSLIAYRLFIWLLPFAVVTVFMVELFREEPIDPQRATNEFGLPGFVAASISQGTSETGKPGVLSAVVVGGFVLLYATYALLRALRAVHALIWRVRPTRVPAPLLATLAGLAGLTALVVGRVLLDRAGEELGGLSGVVLVLASDLVPVVVYVGLASWLPHRARHWTDLLPGAALFGLALALIHGAVVLLLFPYLEQKAATYGSLGLAAGILLALVGVGWAVTLAAALNSELCDRRSAGRAPTEAA